MQNEDIFKNFIWYLRKGVIFTKDNLAKRNWHGSLQCVFCQHNETIKHLFFQCGFARSIWLIIQMASNLYPPCNIANMFDNWLWGTDDKYRILIRGGSVCLNMVALAM